MQVDVPDRPGQQDADHAQDEVLLLEAGEEGLDGVDSDLVADPRVDCAGDEGEPEPPYDLRREDRPERGGGSLDEEADADDGGADERGQPPRVEVGDDAGGDLEEDATGLEHGSDDDELGGGEVGGLHLVEQDQREGEGLQQRPRPLPPQVGGAGWDGSTTQQR